MSTSLTLKESTIEESPGRNAGIAVAGAWGRAVAAGGVWARSSGTTAIRPEVSHKRARRNVMQIRE